MSMMPEAVAKLPRDERGYPVPWVSLWVDGADPDESPEVTRWDPVHGAVVDCPCETGVGRPRLGRICPVRQRTGVLERICGTCGESITGWSAWPVDNIGGKITEAPNHPACFAYSLTACPFLRNAPRRFESFRVLLAKDYRYTFGREVLHPVYGEVIGEFPGNAPAEWLRSMGVLVLVFIDTTSGDLVTVDGMWDHPAMSGVACPM